MNEDEGVEVNPKNIGNHSKKGSKPKIDHKNSFSLLVVGCCVVFLCVSCVELEIGHTR